MRKYEKPVLKVCEIRNENIITTSGGLVVDSGNFTGVGENTITY